MTWTPSLKQRCRAYQQAGTSRASAFSDLGQTVGLELLLGISLSSNAGRPDALSEERTPGIAHRDLEFGLLVLLFGQCVLPLDAGVVESLHGRGILLVRSATVAFECNACISGESGPMRPGNRLRPRRC